MAIDPISRFEDSVQRLVEGGLARLFAGQLQAREVALQIIRCMEDQAIPDDAGRRHAPDIFRVRLNPADHQAIIASHPEIAHALGQEILHAAEAATLVLNSVPLVKIFSDPELLPHHVHVSAEHASQSRDATESMVSRSMAVVRDEPRPDARLLLDGGRVFTLAEPVVNLGRQRDNQIILDDPSVSRHHAQIRLRFGHFTLFDLGSTTGTAINGQKVREAMLRSGDIISLGSQSLIYLDEASSTPDEEEGDTGQMNAELT
jgi:hypothetical protein